MGRHLLNLGHERLQVSSCALTTVPKLQFSRVRCQQVGLVLDDNPGFASPVFANEIKENSRVFWVQAHTSMRGRFAQPADLVCSVDSIATQEKNRMRHGGVVVFARLPHLVKSSGPEGAPRCAIAFSPRRNLPRIKRLFAVRNRQALIGDINAGRNNSCRCCPNSRRECENDRHHRSRTHNALLSKRLTSTIADVDERKVSGTKPADLTSRPPLDQHAGLQPDPVRSPPTQQR